jgi:1-acyl-sn-glycerol-3-phosphate acyltransferase
MKEPIHKYSLEHCLLRSYVDIYQYFFYKEITIIGKENVPVGLPVILAPNHQNALMDAMAILYTLKGQPVFMARSDIFRNSRQAKILRAFKILPIYRIRDGIKSLQNNDQVFEEAVDVLQAGKRLVILPEGSHHGQRRLRPLKKGIARIALMAEDRNNFELGVQIVPVGIDYTHYINFGARLCVSFGKPFPVSKYKEEYHENQQKAMNSLMDELRDKMIPQILHIDNEADYDTFEYLKDLYIARLYNGRPSSAKHWKLIGKSQDFSQKLISFCQSDTETFEQLKAWSNEVKNITEKFSLRLWAVVKDKYPYYQLILGRVTQLLISPFFIIGFLANIFPFQLPVYLARKVKDPQFLSSFRFVLSVITFTFTYLIYLILFLIFIENKLLAFGIFASLPLFGLASFKIYIWFMKTTAKWRINRLHHYRNSEWINLIENRNRIFSVLDQVIHK